MIFSDSFTKVLDELSEEIKRELQRNPGKDNFADVVELSVKNWCRELKISDEVTFYIRDWRQQTEINNLICYVWEKHKPQNSKAINYCSQHEIEASNFSNYVKKLFNLEQATNVKFILLIAFVLTCVGFIIYYSRPQSSQKEQKQIGGATALGQQYALSPDRTTWILVLIINAEKENILQSLKRNRRVMLNEGEILYRATQALWVGSKTELFKSRLGNGFSNNPSMQESEKSEYDVCFVQIEIYKPDPGFAPNANQLDRIDAFRNLPNNSG